MAEYPVLMSDPMVQAVLAGRKTMTRRLATSKNGRPNFWPHVVPGDRLWLKETHACIGWGGEDNGYYEATMDMPGAFMAYRADGKFPVAREDRGFDWKPSIFMPRSACRLVLEVTEIRDERLQEISDADIVREGIDVFLRPDKGEGVYLVPGGHFTKNRFMAWMQLWDMVHGEDSYHGETEVRVVGFKRLAGSPR